MLFEIERWLRDGGKHTIVADAGAGVADDTNIGAITDAEALQAEDARYAAQIEKDLEALERLLGKDLVYIHSSSVQDTKASFIESLRSEKVIYHSMKRSDTVVRTFGNVAIVTGKAEFEVTARGKEKTLNILFHSVWAKRESGVQFVSWQATPIVT
jgi:ketosteroid isomerase-like protein